MVPESNLVQVLTLAMLTALANTSVLCLRGLACKAHLAMNVAELEAELIRLQNQVRYQNLSIGSDLWLTI